MGIGDAFDRPMKTKSYSATAAAAGKDIGKKGKNFSKISAERSGALRLAGSG